MTTRMGALRCLMFLAMLAAASLPAAAGGGAGKQHAGYVADTLCAACHLRQMAAWLGSKHDKAMQPAMPQSVLGDFRGPLPEPFLPDTRLVSDAGGHRVSTPGPDGQIQAFAVTHVLGVRPLQQLLLSLPGGRLQAFTLAWDTVRERWFDLQAEEERPPRPGESLHWSGRYQNWNLMCGECHTTDYRKGYDEAADRYETSWAAGHVGCQACHGPGQDHVAQRQAGQAAVYDRRRDSFGQVDQCAACHARRTRLVEAADHGGHFLDNFMPDTLRPDLYYPDGQQKAEVFEYGSYRQSRMYQAGVACSDCHDSHSGRLHAEGNTLCVRCHNPDPPAKYPGLRAKSYDSPTHHFHQTGAVGSQCVDCHMPSRNYMVVHPRRDHAIRVPRPDLSQHLGTPNACNQCHNKRDAQWAQAVIENHGGKRPPAMHYGEILAAGWRGQGAVAVAALAVDQQQPAIVRATAVELLSRLAPALIPSSTLNDDDPAVRSVAATAIGGLSTGPRAELLPLLRDPVRAVRMAAARSLAGVPDSRLAAGERLARQRGLADYVAAQRAMADMPSAQLNLALLFVESGRAHGAATHFARSLRQDPAFDAGRLSYSRWLFDRGQREEAVKVLRSGLPVAANPPDLHQALALLLAASGKQEEAAEAVAEGLRRQPDNRRLRELQAALGKMRGRSDGR